MHHLIRVLGIFITLTLLLAVVTGSVQLHQARHEQGETIPAHADEVEQAADAASVCLVLIGGTALLAGSAWMGKLRYDEQGREV
jgi:hypothetical protein